MLIVRRLAFVKTKRLTALAAFTRVVNSAAKQ